MKVRPRSVQARGRAAFSAREAVAWMHGIATGAPSDVHQLIDRKIALARRRWADG